MLPQAAINLIFSLYIVNDLNVLVIITALALKLYGLRLYSFTSYLTTQTTYLSPPASRVAERLSRRRLGQ